MDFMANKTYRLKPTDAETLVTLACRYRRVQTSIDEKNLILVVSTTYGDNNEPTTLAAKLALEIESEDPPKISHDEYVSRVEGRPITE